VTSFAAYAQGEQIGQGGSGTVYAVTDQEGKRFALKLLRPDLATSSKRKRFQNEISFCSTFRHTSILQIVDHGPYKDRRGETMFYVMPIYPRTLRTLMNARVDRERLFGILLQVIHGVNAAHKQKTWHRDLKPENILVSDDLSKVVVADWGIAHFSADVLYTLVETAPEERLANFEYAAPEQRRRGLPVDHRADIYAIGLMLNEIFTGSVPHGTSHARIIDHTPDFSFLD
jgi:serine/threonine protein kinase